MGTKSDSKKEYIKFTGDIGWVSIYRVVVYLFAFFTIPALTKNLGTELYGLWNQILVTVGFLTPILMLHLGTAAARYLPAQKDKDQISQSFSNMLWIIILLSATAIILSLIFSSDLSQIMFHNRNYGSFAILSILYAATSALFDYMIAYLRAKGKIKQLSIINILSYFFMTGSLIVLASLGYSLEFMIWIYLLIYLIFLASLSVSIIREIDLRKPKLDQPNLDNLKKYITFSLPQIPNAILLWVVNLSDRYLITFFLGLAQTGIYSASYNIGSVIMAFYMPISFVLLPIVAKYWDDGERLKVKKYLEYSTKIFLVLAIPASVGLYVLSKPLLQLLTTSEFVVGGILTFLVALGYIFLGVFQINTLIILLVEKTKYRPLITGIAGVINIVLNIILIPQIGIMGAAVATLISYMVIALIVSLWARNVVNYSMDYIFLAKVIVSSTVMALIIQYLVFPTIFGIILVLVVGLAVYVGCIFALKTLSAAEKEILHDMMQFVKNAVIRTP